MATSSRKAPAANTSKPSAGQAVRDALDDVFVRRVLFVVAVVGVIALAFKLAAVLLMLFGSLLIAILFRSVAGLLNQYAKLPMKAALPLSMLFFLAVLAAGFGLLWMEISQQLDRLPDTLPEAAEAARQRIETLPFGGRLLERIQTAAEGAGLSGGVSEAAQELASQIRGFVGSAGGFMTNTVLVLAGGVYLALNPKGYRDGLLMLVPKDQRRRIGNAFDQAGRGLRLWLLGAFLDMIGVGVITGLGLWAVGLPSPVLLGVLAGLGVLVPIVGPTLAAIPGLLLAVAYGPDTVLWTLAVYVVVQQIESNLIMPVVQRQVVSLPPLLTLFSVAVFGLMFGPIGVLLSVPLAVVSYILIRALYVRDTLGERIRPLDVGKS